MTAVPTPAYTGDAPLVLPDYDADHLTAGIVHFGFGSFHRAHQAVYLDRLMSDGLAHDWAIVGVNVLPGDSRIHEVMLAQRGRYTSVLKHEDGQLEGRVVGSVVEHLLAPDDAPTILERLSDPNTRIVSLTITEGGYEVDPASGRFTPSSGPVLADLSDQNETRPPQSVFGFIVAGLKRRRARGIEPFTVLSCDNVQSNGNVAATSIIEFARSTDPELAEWIAASVSFPNSMVDRITPLTTDADRILVRDVFGIHDAWPIVSEPFTQWVIEDRFPGGRPPWELVGAQFVDDVAPYEKMKLRLLNASHQVLAHPALLLGHERVDQAVDDPTIRALVEAWFAEARPTLDPVPGIDLDEYTATLLKRYSNQGIRDTVARLATDAPNRLAGFVLPVIRDLQERGNPSPVGCFALAARLFLEVPGERDTLLGGFTDPQVIEAVERAEAHIRQAGVTAAIQSMLTQQ